MTNKEFKKYLLKATHPNAFNELIIEIDYPHVNFAQQFKGLAAFYDFLQNQVEVGIKLKRNYLMNY